MEIMTIYTLGPDDMPTCPTHGTRVVTDFFVAEDGLTYERGKCPLCKKTYSFWVEDSEVVGGQFLTSS
jgi:hypothetical protein